MVTRPGNLYKTPSNSRGTSPARSTTRRSPLPSPSKNNNSNRTTMRRSGSKGRIGQSPDRRSFKSQPSTPERKTGSSPASKSMYELNSSHGSE